MGYSGQAQVTLPFAAARLKFAGTGALVVAEGTEAVPAANRAGRAVRHRRGCDRRRRDALVAEAVRATAALCGGRKSRRSDHDINGSALG